MSLHSSGVTSFRTTVKLLWRMAWRRGRARAKHQKELFSYRKKKAGKAGGGIGFSQTFGTFIAVVFALFIHGMFALMVSKVVDAGVHTHEERAGVVFVGNAYLASLKQVRQMDQSTKNPWAEVVRLRNKRRAVLSAALEAERRRYFEANHFSKSLADAHYQRLSQKIKDDNPAHLVEAANGRIRDLPDGLTFVGDKYIKALEIANKADGFILLQTKKRDLLNAALQKEWRRYYNTNGHNESLANAHFNSLWKKIEAGRPAYLVEGNHISLKLLSRNQGEIKIEYAFVFVIVCVWFFMLAFQGEGMDLDIQRRRHPTWEWLLSHPVRPGAVFFAEMLAPLIANPIYFCAPIFWIGLLTHFFPFGSSLLAGLFVGLLMAVAAVCMSKSVEVWVMLRCSPRSRGALLGLLSWGGYIAMLLPFVLIATPGVFPSLVRSLTPIIEKIANPYFPILFGYRTGGAQGFSLLQTVAVWSAVACIFTLLSVVLSARATLRGLGGNFGGTIKTRSAASQMHGSFFSRDPLFRKELLWFLRDRGALIQALLIPLTVSLYQIWNLRFVAHDAMAGWNRLSGIAVIFGTYFLFILGPRSLVSEGNALWLAHTWPNGLEGVLKAKAKLWAWMANGVVCLVLIFAAVHFPADSWKVALVAIGWFAFSQSLAEKMVTLATAPSSSGEPEPVPRSRRWGATLGTFTFAIGLMTHTWSLAIVGIVYSWLTAAAMWQSFRERLPFFFDPWSEKIPKPPTLVHAMIAVAGMVEGMAVIYGFCIAAFGKDSLFVVRTLAYGVSALLTWIITQNILKHRGVAPMSIWHWKRESANTAPREKSAIVISDLSFCGATLLIGCVLGFLAVGYQQALTLIPYFAKAIALTHKEVHLHPANLYWMMILGVGFAPLAEEYLFRGLLFRSLDREWGGWRAIWGSALFFCIYHPPFAWIPVALLGALNAWIYKRSGSLFPCVALHAAYNAIVIMHT